MTEAVLGAGELTPGTSAASERVQQLQAMIAELSRGPASFASQLNAAMSSSEGSTGVASSATTARASTMVTPATDAALVGASAQGAGQLTYAGLQAAPAVAGEATLASGAGASFSALPTSTASASGEGSGNASAYAGLVNQAAARNGIEPAILFGLIQQESGFDPNSASGAGAQGLTQLMPGTAASLGVTEPLNPAQSIEGGARYLGEMMRQFGGNVSDALAAYNAGPGAVQQYGGVPPYSETQQYVTKVLGYAASYRQGAGPTATQGAIA